MAMHECAQNHPEWSCLVKGRMRDLNSKAEEEEELMPKGPTIAGGEAGTAEKCSTDTVGMSYVRRAIIMTRVYVSDQSSDIPTVSVLLFLPQSNNFRGSINEILLVTPFTYAFSRFQTNPRKTWKYAPRKFGAIRYVSMARAVSPNCESECENMAKICYFIRKV